MLEQIRTRMHDLRPSEQRVAAVVLADPDAAVGLSIANLAGRAEVSEPTVIRFCRALDCAGFQDFKLALARDLGGRLRYASQALEGADGTDRLIDKIGRAAQSSLDRLIRELDPAALEQATAALIEARHIEFCGLGGAGIVAADAQLKFARLGLSAVAYADAYIHQVTASLLGPRDVLVAISNSGRSRDLIGTVELARAAGARVIALCPRRSPLAERSDQVLIISDVDDDPFTPIRARVAHMVVVDMLAIGVALRLGPAVHRRLDRAREVLRERFIDR